MTETVMVEAMMEAVEVVVKDLEEAEMEMAMQAVAAWEPAVVVVTALVTAVKAAAGRAVVGREEMEAL